MGICCLIFLYAYCTVPESTEASESYDVIVIGAGTGATSAAIQAARSNSKTLWINELEWPGGMLTSAGVSATDGNNQMPAGAWGEFQALVRTYYGGPDSVFTGWVSNTMFEPKIGAKIFNELIDKESNLTLIKGAKINEIENQKKWLITFQKNKDIKIVSGKILVDGTDLGDLAASLGCTFDLGMDTREKTSEEMAPTTLNTIVQDLTYAAILKDFGKGTDHTIPKPPGYDPQIFYCACQTKKCTLEEKPHPCDKMLSYGKLPNQKYMINWPKHGNDYYANVVGLSKEERARVYQEAKNKTLQFVYFIQTELGYKNLGLAEDEFPTKDRLPLYPYHREGRRIHGAVQLNVNHLMTPYEYTLYRTGIAVGDYPIDHHHAENPDAPEIDFPSVPSFSIPIGCLLPKKVDRLVMADKAISVTNIVNGASRLQPVILQVGQVAGLIAATAAERNVSPKNLDIRDLQAKLLACKGYLLPFIDVPPDDKHFIAIQSIGATGLLRGKGIPYKWANQTWFYPDSVVNVQELKSDLLQFDKNLDFVSDEKYLSVESGIDLLDVFINRIGGTKGISSNNLQAQIANNWEVLDLENFDLKRLLTRRELAVVLNHFVDPFLLKRVELDGSFRSLNKKDT